MKVQREQGEPFDVTLVRDFIKIKSVRSQIFDGIGYVRLTTFSEQTSPGLQDAVGDFFASEGDNLKGIVLDLRNNPGGLLNEAVRSATLSLRRARLSRPVAATQMKAAMSMQELVISHADCPLLC